MCGNRLQPQRQAGSHVIVARNAVWPGFHPPRVPVMVSILPESEPVVTISGLDRRLFRRCAAASLFFPSSSSFTIIDQRDTDMPA